MMQPETICFCFADLIRGDSVDILEMLQAYVQPGTPAWRWYHLRSGKTLLPFSERAPSPSNEGGPEQTAANLERRPRKRTRTEPACTENNMIVVQERQQRSEGHPEEELDRWRNEPANWYLLRDIPDGGGAGQGEKGSKKEKEEEKEKESEETTHSFLNEY